MRERWLKRRGERDRSYKPVILVTGCASGIGLALAELLYEETEYRVVVTARRHSLEELRERFIESERFWIECLDVRLESERDSLIERIANRWGGVDILINNAGISYRAVLEHMTESDELLQMETNYLGPVGLMRAVLPSMRAKGRGKIINISSVSGMLAMPTMASYSASKYALEGASEALWYETKPLGINVCLVQPGFIRSNSFERVYHTKRSRLSPSPEEPYADYYGHMAPFVRRLMGLSLTTPENVACQVLDLIRTENPPLWVAATIDASVFSILRRLVPRRWFLPLLFALLPKANQWAKGYTNRRPAWSKSRIVRAFAAPLRQPTRDTTDASPVTADTEKTKRRDRSRLSIGS